MTTPKTLWWSQTAEIACDAHAPERDSHEWRVGRWREMTLAERIQHTAEVGEAPRCDTCAANDWRAQS